MPASDPFGLVYTALFDMIAARDDFRELVRVNNQIRFDSATDRDPIKVNIITADLPEVALWPTGTLDVNLCSSSSGSMIVRQYGWYIATGDLRYTIDLARVEWAIFTGMLDWQTKVTSLQWCNKSFVKRADFVDVINGFADIEANRGIQGWSAIWNCEVEMHFLTKDLRDGCP